MKNVIQKINIHRLKIWQLGAVCHSKASAVTGYHLMQ